MANETPTYCHVGSTTPSVVRDGVRVSDYWVDTTNSVHTLKKCTSISPVTFSTITSQTDFNSQNITETGTIQAATSVWWHVQHIGGASLNPGASGPTLVSPSADSAGGYQLDVSTEELFFDAHAHNDWDGASDLIVKVLFEVNVDNSAGGVSDTVDLRLRLFYKGDGQTACRTQTLEIATTVGQSARYKQFTVNFTVDWDAVDNVVVASDDLGMILNLETDSSEVDNVIITHVAFEYKTAKVNPEV